MNDLKKGLVNMGKFIKENITPISITVISIILVALLAFLVTKFFFGYDYEASIKNMTTTIQTENTVMTSTAPVASTKKSTAPAASEESKEITEPQEDGQVSLYVLSNDIAYSDTAAYSPSDLRQAGAFTWNGWKWTYYSERILPGNGLWIPGRYTDSDGFVCDENGYICLASTSVSRHTTLITPFGRIGKVYDTGCAYGVMDVYVNW
jgi:hypothetical protein